LRANLLRRGRELPLSILNPLLRCLLPATIMQNKNTLWEGRDA
jgi:hypothetical protein